MANNKTFMEVPPDIQNPLVLKRFLLQLIQNIDIAFGNRGKEGFTKSQEVTGISNTVAERVFNGQIFNTAKRYIEQFSFNNDRDIVDRGFIFKIVQKMKNKEY